MTKAGLPKVSVLIASYNYGKFVSTAIDSVLGQNYEGEIECIVVDDGSTDNTAEALRKYNDQIIFIRQENAGQPAAFNAAYFASSGEIVCLLDADDSWKPNKVKAVVECFENEPNVGLVHHALEIVDEKGAPIKDFHSKFKPARGDVSREMIKKALPYNFSFCSGVSVRKKLCEFIFPLSIGIKYCGDGLIANSAALLAPVHYIDEVLGTYVIHGNNIWASDSLKRKRGQKEEDEKSSVWRLREIEEKIIQANAALERAGLRGGLSRWLSWNYIKHSSMMDNKGALTYMPLVLKALQKTAGIGLLDKATIASNLFKKALKHNRHA